MSKVWASILVIPAPLLLLLAAGWWAADQDPNRVTALATVAVGFATVVYAYFVHRTIGEMRQQRGVMERQVTEMIAHRALIQRQVDEMIHTRLDSVQPLIAIKEVRFDLDAQTGGCVTVRAGNIGLGPALNVELRLTLPAVAVVHTITLPPMAVTENDEVRFRLGIKCDGAVLDNAVLEASCHDMRRDTVRYQYELRAPGGPPGSQLGEGGVKMVGVQVRRSVAEPA